MNFWLHFCLSLFLNFASTRALPPHPPVRLPAEGEMFEGDLIVTPNLKKYAEGSKDRKREVHQFTFPWSKTGNFAKIPYTMNGLSNDFKTKVKLAMASFKGQSCVAFVPRKDEKDYIDFVAGKGCASSVGHQGGRQEIILGSGCGSLSTIQHEIMHSLGFLHEQTREDRDDFIVIKYENIQPGSENQFQTYAVNTFDQAYDLHSLMQYKRREFSKNGLPTIVSKRDGNEELGNNKYLTKTDLMQLNTLYSCPSRFFQVDDYEILVYTSNKWYASTGANVFIEMKGNKDTDTSGELKLGNEFNTGSVVKIDHFFPQLDVLNIVVRHDNTGWGAGWHLEKLIIKDKTRGTSFTFSCNCWVDGKDNAKTLS